jgi:hypothetical protein
MRIHEIRRDENDDMIIHCDISNVKEAKLLAYLISLIVKAEFNYNSHQKKIEELMEAEGIFTLLNNNRKLRIYGVIGQSDENVEIIFIKLTIEHI